MTSFQEHGIICVPVMDLLCVPVDVFAHFVLKFQSFLSVLLLAQPLEWEVYHGKHVVSMEVTQ